MIPQQNLSRLSNRLAERGGRRIPEAILERDYCIAWFLASLSLAPLHYLLVFKGGTALKHCYFGDYRFSEDLDFTLLEKVSFENIRDELEPVFAEAGRASGINFRFVREDRNSHANSHTFYLGYEGPLPASSASKEVKVDVTIRERIVFPIEDRPVLRSYEAYSDLPDNARVRVYSLNEIASEKIVALTDRARNEPRDLYDLWHLVVQRRVDLKELIGAVNEKWAFRGGKPADLKAEFLAKEARLKKLWSLRLANQMAQVPEYEEVFRTVQRALRQAGLFNK